MKKKRKYADSLKIIADLDHKNIEVVMDPADAESADVVVCRSLTTPLILPDNLTGICSKCGAPIQFRPHAPKRPPKMCDTCAFPMMEKENEKGELHAMITPKTLDDVIRYMVKKWSN